MIEELSRESLHTFHGESFFNAVNRLLRDGDEESFATVFELARIVTKLDMFDTNHNDLMFTSLRHTSSEDSLLKPSAVVKAVSSLQNHRPQNSKENNYNDDMDIIAGDLTIEFNDVTTMQFASPTKVLQPKRINNLSNTNNTSNNKTPKKVSNDNNKLSPNFEMSDEEFGHGHIPSHARSPSMVKLDKLMTPNSKRLSSTMDCNAILHQYLSNRQERKKQLANNVSKITEENILDNEIMSEERLKQIKEKKRMETRTNLKTELLETECNYVKNLETLIRVFVRPITEMACKNTLGLNKDVTKRLFLNVEMITLLHRQFLKHLMEAESNQLFEVFVSNADFLKIYTDYVSKFDGSIHATLTQLQNNKRFQRFMKSLMKTKGRQCHGNTMLDFLILPIQRIPRYELLLKSILENTSSDHEEYPSVKAAYDKVCQIGHHVNENKRHVENMDHILSISKRIKGIEGGLMQPHRRFIRQGVIKQLMPKRKDYEYILFNDLIAWIKNNRYVNSINLSDARVYGSQAFHLHLIHIKQGNDEMVMQFQNIDERDSWISDIIKAKNLSIQSTPDLKVRYQRRASERQKTNLVQPKKLFRRSTLY